MSRYFNQRPKKTINEYYEYNDDDTYDNYKDFSVDL